MEPLMCEQCGGPMKDRKLCPWCRTEYYTGPELPEKPPEFYGMSAGSALNSYSTLSTHLMSSRTHGGYVDSWGQPVIVKIGY